MNRRTFLKTVGAVSALSMSNISFAKEEQQWISFLDETPKAGQKIVSLHMFKSPPYLRNSKPSLHKTMIQNSQIKYISLTIEKVLCDLDPRVSLKNHLYLRTKHYLQYEIDLHKRINIITIRMPEPFQELQERTKILKSIIEISSKFEKGVDHCKYIKDTSTCFYRHPHKNSYWLPIDKEIPTTLPVLPELK